MVFPLLGLFGGTFDPIHNGHLAVAEGLLSCLPLEEIQLIPCRLPPHGKHPIASIERRVAMIKLAICDKPHIVLNTIETERDGISYMIDTVKLCQKKFPNKALCLILATDVFSHLNEWYQWQGLLNHCHFIIAKRPTFSLPNETWMIELLKKHQTERIDALTLQPAGKILFQSPTPSTITSTEVRDYLAKGNFQAAASLLPKKVFDYIQLHRLYGPNGD